MPTSSGAPPRDFIAAFEHFTAITEAEAKEARAAHLARGLSLTVIIHTELRHARAVNALTSLRSWSAIDTLADGDDTDDDTIDLADDAESGMRDAMTEARAVIADWREARRRRSDARQAGRGNV